MPSLPLPMKTSGKVEHSRMTCPAVAHPTNRLSWFAETIDRLESMPGVEAILEPLLSYLQKPFEQQDVQRIVDLISHDNSLTAQCLHMANSPLFGHWQKISTARAAVMVLGLQRMREIVLSCCVVRLATSNDGNSAIALWEHSLACALLSRKMARRISAPDPEQIYIAGLLHDLGFMINLRLAPDEFGAMLSRARAEKLSVAALEQEQWGCTHCEIGTILAEKWQLPPLVGEVIRCHHNWPKSTEFHSTVALVGLCDEMCRINGLGYGYAEVLEIDWNNDIRLQSICEEWPVARLLDWRQVSAEMNGYLAEVRKLVTVLFRLKC